MNSEEIEQLLVNSEKSIRLDILSMPVVGWSLSAGAALIGIYSSHVPEGLVFAVPLAFVALSASVDHLNRWNKLKSHRAELIWRHLVKTIFKSRFSGVTAILAEDIGFLYQVDPRGEVLPLQQAVRLVDTHHKQQRRLAVVLERLAALHSIGAALREKTERLRALGEGHEQGETRLKTMREDETALDNMREQILASCHRLEMILIETQKAQQMRQLYSEINALTQEKPHSNSSEIAIAQGDSLIDIERQITREVETFLQLERETDRHMREI